jgi:hypothetical protein
LNSCLEFEKDININKINLNNNNNNFEENYLYKFTAYYCIKYIEEFYSQNDGPYFYRVPKNDPELKNEFAFDVFKIFKNNSQVPKNRMLLQIIIYNDLKEMNEEEFIKKSENISEIFINKIIENLKDDINKNYNDIEFKKNINLRGVKILEEENKKEEEEKKNDDNKNEEKNNENTINEEKKIEEKKNDDKEKYEIISLNPEIILSYLFLNKINLNSYKCESKYVDNINNNIIFTKNNFTIIDLDFYFNESEKIINEFNLPKNITETIQKKYNEDIEDEDQEDNQIIDELFNEINLEEEENKKEEEKKEEEKK